MRKEARSSAIAVMTGLFATGLLATEMLAAQTTPPADQQSPKSAASTPTDPRPEQVSKAMGRGEGRLSPGDQAPDFQLNYLHSKERIRLSRFQGKKPVALIFGSYT